jgi:hypothetical protein
MMKFENSSAHDLPGTTSKSASGFTTPDLVAAEKNQHDQSDGEKEPEQIQISPVDEEEYPTGSSFVFIVISLILSVFLVALDMVGG